MIDLSSQYHPVLISDTVGMAEIGTGVDTVDYQLVISQSAPASNSTALLVHPLALLAHLYASFERSHVFHSIQISCNFWNVFHADDAMLQYC